MRIDPDSPLIVGLDHASNRWHAVTRQRRDDGKVQIDIAQATAADSNPDVRRATLAKAFRQVLWTWRGLKHGGPFFIFAEEPLALQNGKTTRLLGLAAGALWAQHLEHNCFWVWVDNQTWKKHIGVGEYKTHVDVLAAPERQRVKQAITVCSIERHGGSLDWDEDLHDANGLSVYGWDWYAPSRD